MRKILENLIIKPTYFAPILQVKEDGNFKYTRVKEYSSRWLKHNKAGVLKKPDEYESLCPFDLWMEDRWRFIRRMAGDAFCQKALYGVCTFIWLANGVQIGTEVKRYQDALIENVFRYKNKRAFLDQEKLDIEVTTFDGQLTGFISWDDLKQVLRHLDQLQGCMDETLNNN